MQSGKMEACKSQEILKRQIAIFRMVSDDVADRLEKATGIKGYESIKDMGFNGTHNGLAKQREKKNANGMKNLPSARVEGGNVNGGPVAVAV
jgi:catalase